MTIGDFWVVLGGTVTMLVVCLVAGYLMQGGTLGDMFVMFLQALGAPGTNNNQEVTFSPATTTPQNSNNGIAITATERNDLLLQAKAEALAAMVLAGKIGETDGIKIVFGVSPSSSNPRYQAARSALKAAMERLTNHYPNRTPEQKRAREALGLDKHAA